MLLSCASLLNTTFLSLNFYFLLLYFIYNLVQVVPSAPAASDADTDYSDPFDARPDPRPNWEPKSVPTDRCSYMEPFEAQRIISG